MTNAIYLRTDTGSIDSLEAETFRKRLEIASDCLDGLLPGATRDRPPPDANARGAKANLARHMTFYGPAGHEPASAANHRVSINIEYDAMLNRDMLNLHIKSGFDRLSLHFIEPIAEDRFNALDPLAPIEQVAAILTRWRGWMDRLVMPTTNPLRSEMEADLGPALTGVLELLRTHGYGSDNARMGEFDIVLPSPFRLPQISWSPPSGTDGFKPQACFTPEGRAWLAAALPTMLRFQHWRNQSGLEFKVLPDKIESELFGPEPTLIDQMKLLRSLPDVGSAELLLPFQEPVDA